MKTLGEIDEEMIGRQLAVSQRVKPPLAGAPCSPVKHDTEHRDTPMCPTCGRELSDPCDMPSDLEIGILDCDHCGTECQWERIVTVTFTTRAANNKLRHGGEKEPT